MSEDTSRLTGDDSNFLIIGGKRFELKPLCPYMSSNMIKYFRKRAIDEWYQNSKGMPFDIINAQMSRFNSLSNGDEFYSYFEMLTYILYERTKNKDMTIDDYFCLPTKELEALDFEILDIPRPAPEDEEKKISGETETEDNV